VADSFIVEFDCLWSHPASKNGHLVGYADGAKVVTRRRYEASSWTCAHR
jgi:hypothetical protein